MAYNSKKTKDNTICLQLVDYSYLFDRCADLQTTSAIVCDDIIRIMEDPTVINSMSTFEYLKIKNYLLSAKSEIDNTFRQLRNFEKDCC